MNGYVNSEPGTTRHGSLDTLALPRGGKLRPSLRQELETLSRRSLQGCFAFLAISCGFFSIRGIDLLAPLTEGTRELLGNPPPPLLTTLALVLYLLSEVVLILGRTASGAKPLLKWQQLVYRTVFFFFYAVANVLDHYFLGVFVAGLVIFGLELLNLWVYSMKILPQGEEIAGKL